MTLLTHDAQLTLQVTDELEIGSLLAFRDVLLDAVARHPARLVVELADCAFLDVQALPVLAEAAQELAAKGSLLVLRGCREEVRRLLELSGLRGVLQEDDGPGSSAAQLHWP